MQSAVLTAALALVLAAPASAEVESRLNRTHRQWESRILQDGDVQMYRALTVYSRGNDYVVLTLDRNPEDCTRQYIHLNIVMNRPSDRDFTSETLHGQMQVDARAIHGIEFSVSVYTGNATAIASVNRFEDSDRLLNELIGGRQVWFKLAVNEETFYMPFSLIGFTAAQNRTLALCENGGREPPPAPKPKPAPPAPEIEVNPF